MAVEGIKIMVLDRGFVKIALVKRHPELAFHWFLEKSRTIRVWGTSKGLAELVNGPTDSTVMDHLHSSTVPFRAVLDIIDVREEKWKKHLS